MPLADVVSISDRLKEKRLYVQSMECYGLTEDDRLILEMEYSIMGFDLNYEGVENLDKQHELLNYKLNFAERSKLYLQFILWFDEI